MENRMIHVPAATLLDPELNPSEKVVWMALRLHPSADRATLEQQTGLSRPTVVLALQKVLGSKYTPAGPRVRIPAALLAERSVGAQAKVLYGLLQLLPYFREPHGQFTYTALCELTHLSRNTLKRAVADLAAARWIQTTQVNRLHPIRFRLGTPALHESLAEVAAARRRLKRENDKGEAIMQEYLTLLIDSAQFTDNARPGFLISPVTRERLELDRYYPALKVAFEFHGEQHFRATGRFSQPEVDAQQYRDLIKAGLCVYQGIRLIIIQAEELSLQKISRKLPADLPRRDLSGHEPLIDLLEDASIAYCAAAAAAAEPNSSSTSPSGPLKKIT